MVTFILAAIVGHLMHVLKKLALIEEEAQRFNFKTWWKRNKFRTTLGLCLSIASVFALENAGQLTIIACLLTGFTGSSIFTKDKK